jgi:hypothetical protein
MHVPKLLDHLVDCNINSQVYAWGPLSTFFGNLFSRSDWSQVWDNIIFNPSEFLYFILIAHLKLSSGALMSITSLSDFEVFTVSKQLVLLFSSNTRKD